MPPFKATNNPNQPAAPDNAGGTATAVKPQRQAIKPPPMYRVLLLNDDFTPM
ncbi:MAG: ATP-dependent Clp protease adaptor ClpS, partial [Brachymonas sp.]|nr:ATP-dependent Clp protease adaptor ClpS [Brachymonas sp.]